jgi:hypothetical protein
MTERNLTKVLLDNVKGRAHLGDLVVDVRLAWRLY